MGLTTTIVSNNVIGSQRANLVTVAFDSSYPTGGEAITAAQVGLRARIDAIIPAGATPYATGAYTVEYDASTGKLLAVSLADGAQAGASTNLGELEINVLAIGA